VAETPRIPRQLANEVGKVVSPTQTSALFQQMPWLLFLLVAESIAGRNCGGKIKWPKNFNVIIGI